jgi:hypothetical protein
MARAVPTDDRAEAHRWLSAEVERLLTLPYDDLKELAGTSQRREMHTASGRTLDLETEIALDGNPSYSLYVTVNVSDRSTEGKAGPTELAHDEFALTPDGHGGLIGPVRRREAAEHTPAGRAGRYLSMTIVFAFVWIAFGWANAADRHFSEGAIGLAWASTGLWLVAIALNVWRWRRARDS